MALRDRLPIPSFDPPPEVLERQQTRTRQVSVKDRPLPPTPVAEDPYSRHETSSSIGHRGYRRDQIRQEYAKHDNADARRYAPEWHSPQYERRPRQEGSHPANHFLNDKFERDHPHNFHHNPPHYKPSIKQEKRYHKLKLRDHGSRPNPLARCSNCIVGALEEAFYRLGYGVGKYPYVPIVLVIVLALACASGVRLLETETNGARLWVPSNAPGLQDSRLAATYFPANQPRVNTLIVESKDDHILTPTSLKAMADLHEEIIRIPKNKTDVNFNAVCEMLGNQCAMRGLLELWRFDLTVIRGLDQPTILNAINTVTKSPVYNIDFDVTKYISKIKRDIAGSIVSAEASQMIYILRSAGSDRNETLSEPMQAWESEFLEVGEMGHSDLEVFRYAFRSRADEGFGAIFGDVILLSAGYALVILFVMLVLGRFSLIEHKIFVSLTGIACIAMALGVSLGLGSYAKLVYSPLNSILPFLLLGLGVDDMFVIVGALENLTPHQKHLPVPERIGFVLKSAGVSITVTSLTDMLAFGVGISTNLPALRSFCTYCLMGILFTFVFQCTFFVAWLSVDQLRADAHRDACLFCIKYRRWSPNSCSNILFVKSFFRRFYSRFITHIAVKVIVGLLTAGLLAFGIYGTINLEQDSDWTSFIPGGSYAKEYLEKADEYFPSTTEGIPTSVFLIDVDYYNNYTILEQLHKDLEMAPYTENGTTRSWWYSYRAWLNTTTDSNVVNLGPERYPSSESNFYDILINHFLTSPDGMIFKQDIVLNATGGIVASRNRLRHHMLTDTTEQVRAMDNIREIVRLTGFPRENAFAYARQYLSYEGNKAIQQELYRNLGLAFLCVAVMTLILLANIITSFFICLCVIMTVVDVGGMMFFWGLTIDTVTSIILILAMGLSIDFAAHIGHMFMTTRGSRNDRVRRTVVLIGPAVFYGGFSTFLAFLLLAFSKTYVFQTFFKVFLGVVLFGMWHGLAFLPVILSLMGPQPYVTAHHDADGDEAEDRGRAGWDEKDRVDTGFFDPRSDPQFAYSHHSNPRHSPSPAQSSLHSAGYLQRSQMERERQRRSGRWPSHSSRHSDPRLQGYIPRATAFSSRRYSEGTTRQLMGHGALGTPRYYVKPMSYSKPAMYIKPSFRGLSDGPWPPPKRRY